MYADHNSQHDVTAYRLGQECKTAKDKHGDHVCLANIADFIDKFGAHEPYDFVALQEATNFGAFDNWNYEEIDQDENRIAEILEVQTLKLQSEPQCIEINYEELYLNLTIQYFRKLINKLQTA